MISRRNCSLQEIEMEFEDMDEEEEALPEPPSLAALQQRRASQVPCLVVCKLKQKLN